MIVTAFSCSAVISVALLSWMLYVYLSPGRSFLGPALIAMFTIPSVVVSVALGIKIVLQLGFRLRYHLITAVLWMFLWGASIPAILRLYNQYADVGGSALVLVPTVLIVLELTALCIVIGEGRKHLSKELEELGKGLRNR